MSIHSSLTSSSKVRSHRSVFKKYERFGILKKKGEWKENSSIFGLPKIRNIRIKIRKEKAVKESATPAPVVSKPAAGAEVSQTAKKTTK